MILVNGRETEWEEGLTIRGVMERFRYASPKVVVKVNGVVVRPPEWERTMIRDGDEVQVLHLIGGG